MGDRLPWTAGRVALASAGGSLRSFLSLAGLGRLHVVGFGRYPPFPFDPRVREVVDEHDCVDEAWATMREIVGGRLRLAWAQTRSSPACSTPPEQRLFPIHRDAHQAPKELAPRQRRRRFG